MLIVKILSGKPKEDFVLSVLRPLLCTERLKGKPASAVVAWLKLIYAPFCFVLGDLWASKASSVKVGSDFGTTSTGFARSCTRKHGCL